MLTENIKDFTKTTSFVVWIEGLLGAEFAVQMKSITKMYFI